jgi:hypothetical protein
MKLLTEKLTDTIKKELSKPLEEQKLKEFDKLISDMKKAGLIKKPMYDLPLVDTIGKTYYASINKHK